MSDPSPVMQRWTVDQAGLRLDLFLTHRLELGRAQVRKLLAAGQVSVNGRTAAEGDKGKLLALGSVVSVESFARPEQTPVVPQPELPLTILAQGGGWLAVDKPAGQAVHPLRAGECGTLLNAAVARYPQLQGIGEAGLRSGVVHRLDIDTSGALLIATTQPMWQTLREQFTGHDTRKTYRALVRGQLRGHHREVMDLLIAQHHPARVSVVPQQELPKPRGTRRCDLSWRVVEHFGSRATLLEVQLGTGFLHQIRVMLAALGHAVLGDSLYGEPGGDAVPVPRLMLHASYVAAGPAAGHSPDPPDFAAVLGRWR